MNRIKISSDKDPLEFAKKLLESASQTVTLSVNRQSTSATQSSYGGFALTPGIANTPVSPLPGSLSMSVNPMESEIERRLRKISGTLLPSMESSLPLSLPCRPAYYKYSSVS